MGLLNRGPFSLAGGPLKPIGGTPFFKTLFGLPSPSAPESPKQTEQPPAVTTPPTPVPAPVSVTEPAPESIVSEKEVLVEDVAPTATTADDVSAETTTPSEPVAESTETNTVQLETLTVEPTKPTVDEVVEEIVEEILAAPVPVPAETPVLVSDTGPTDDASSAPATSDDTTLDSPKETLVTDLEAPAVEVVITAPAPAPEEEHDLPAPATIVITTSAPTVLTIDTAFSDEASHAPVDAVTILALPNKISSGTQFSDEVVAETAAVEEAIVEAAVEAAVEEAVAETADVEEPAVEQAAPEEIAAEQIAIEDVVAIVSSAPAPVPAPAPKVLIVDPTWMDASLAAPVTPNSILALPNRLPGTVVEQVTVIAEAPVEVAIVAEENAPVEVTVTSESAAPVQVTVKEEVTVAPVAEVLVAESFLGAPVTPAAILALPERIVRMESSVPTVEVVEPVSEVALPHSTPEHSAVEANSAPVSPQRTLALLNGSPLVTPEISAAPAFLRLTPTSQTFLPRNSSGVIAVDHIEDISALRRNPSSNQIIIDHIEDISAPSHVPSSLLSRNVSSNLIVVDHAEDVLASRTASLSQITVEHVETVSAPVDPISPVSISSDPTVPSEGAGSFGLESEISLSKVNDRDTEDSDVESSSDEALEIVKPKKKTAAVIKAIVWPVIHEDDFDAPASSSIDTREIDWEQLLQLDLSWMIPAPTSTAEEKAKAAKVLVKPGERALILAAQRLTL
ncbi:hypothetical protein QBC35DRAFT_497614 [Podospora australis]|uniref:Uncharacterized protein n=1 Tax=Podospora australis TaxID=1536484 RepID=A0AAN7AIJ3_9PEZI|nr:hypothetical protein QBC35DRAFT_497614 [Podospora australis]